MAKRFFIGFLAIVAFAWSALLYGQFQTELPDAPMPAMESSSSSMLPADAATTSQVFHKPAPAKKRRWLTAYGESVAALVSSEVVDSVGTYKNMTHPKFLCGYSAVLGSNSAAISTTEIGIGMQQIGNLCGAPNGRSVNFAYDVTQIGMFTETGLAVKWRLAGNRNYARVEIADITSDVIHVVVVGYLNKKGKWWSRVGNATLLFHAEEHLRLGIGNFQLPNDPNAVFRDHPNVLPPWADAFPSWWGKR
jgi:hypothetical protein